MSAPPIPPSASTPSNGGSSGSGEDAHDPWLRAALRHAPDADAAPPDALRRSILDEARAAAFANAHATQRAPEAGLAASAGGTRRGDVREPARRGAGTRGVLESIGDFWSWLARPAVAAGFASVMAATLVGVMWWDRPLDESLPAATPSVAAPGQATAPAPTPAPAPAVSDRAQTSAASAPPDTLMRADTDGRAKSVEESPSDSPRARSRDKSRSSTGGAAPAQADSTIVATAPQPFPGAAANTTPSQATTAVAKPEALAKQGAGPARQRTEAQAEVEPRRSAPPAPVASPAPALATSPAPAPPPAPALAFAPPPASVPVPVPAPVPTPMLDPTRPLARMAIGAPPAPAAIAAPMVPPPGPSSHPLADLLSSIASDPARWSVLRPDGEHVAIDAALRAWLARVDATTGWNAPPAAADAASDKADTTTLPALMATLTLMRDGRRQAVISIETHRVSVEQRDAAFRLLSMAPLSAQAAAALAASLPAGAR